MGFPLNVYNTTYHDLYFKIFQYVFIFVFISFCDKCSIVPSHGVWKYPIYISNSRVQSNTYKMYIFRDIFILNTIIIFKYEIYTFYRSFWYHTHLVEISKSAQRSQKQKRVVFWPNLIFAVKTQTRDRTYMCAQANMYFRSL